jgi:anti-sigma regulatory factor (Ser/Thr protein kinase)
MTQLTQPLHLRVAATPEAAQIIRTRLRLWLDDLDVNDTAAFELLTACSEAFINAVEHPVAPRRAAVEVEAGSTDSGVVVAVRDYGTWPDRPFSPGRGHDGYPLMCAFVDSIQVDRSRAGTVVTLHKNLWERVDPTRTPSPSTPRSRPAARRRR